MSNKINKPATSRRNFLRGAAAAGLGAAVAPHLGSGIAGAAGRFPFSTPTGDAANPFGLADSSTIDAVIFDGGYGIDYVEFAADLLTGNHPGTTVEVSPSTQIASEMQPRFVGGNPPDLIDNSGAQSMGFNAILDQLEDLTDLVDAPNLEGKTIRDTLYGGVLAAGTFGDKLAAMNYALTIYAVWYSSSLFEENGWELPATWDDALALGEAAAGQDKYLFVWGQQAATYYQTMCIDSAIKEGGDEVRLALENLAEGCWESDAVQGAFNGLKAIVDAGFFMPGGSGTDFKVAQSSWSLDQAALLYPSGSWIENEMKDQTAEGFAIRGFPTLSVSDSGALPVEAIHLTAGEPFIVPSQAANVAGGKELLRTMLSEEAATNFSRTKLAPTVVAGLVPEDGFGSTGLVSQTDMLDAAGENVFTHNFVDFYGTNQEQLVIWNTFLDGGSSVEQLTASLQEITDRIREDDTIEKIVVE